jgi:hypothetical protein
MQINSAKDLDVYSSTVGAGVPPAGPGNGKRERLPYKILPDPLFRNCSHGSASRAHASHRDAATITNNN